MTYKKHDVMNWFKKGFGKGGTVADLTRLDTFLGHPKKKTMI